MKLYFREIGTGEPLIILHGLFGASDNWLTIAKQLAEDYRVFLLDLRNHGRSPHSDIFNFPVMTDDVNEFLHDHNLSRISVMGHSLGGKVAMMLAQSYPQKVEKLIAIDVAPKSYDSSYFIKVIQAMMSLELEGINSLKEANEQIALNIPNPAVRNFILKNLRRNHENTLEWKLNLAAINNNIKNISGEIPDQRIFGNPTLFLKGSNSNYILDDDQQIIKKNFPNSQITTVPGAGHWVQADAPVAVLKSIRSFLSLKPDKAEIGKIGS